MNGELFPSESIASRSPRLIWCEQHGITTREMPRNSAEFRWQAERRHVWAIGVGPTEEDACRDLGVKAGIRLWNEIQ